MYFYFFLVKDGNLTAIQISLDSGNLFKDYITKIKTLEGHNISKYT